MGLSLAFGKRGRRDKVCRGQRPIYARLAVEQLEARTLLSVTSLLPVTNNGIYLYSDQQPTTLSDKMVRFVATHFAGTEKILAADNARYLAVNPNWIQLEYKLGTAAGPALYIHNGTWSSDWSTVTSNENWFMHNTSGQRLHNSQWNWDLNDISNADWQQYWLTSILADMRATGAQGVYADSFTAGVGGGWFNVSDVRFTGTNAGNPADWPGGVTWLQQLTNLSAFMESNLQAQPEHFMYVANVGPLVTSWANMDLSHLDGAELEGFGEWGGASYLNGDASDWAFSMNQALPLSDAGKMLIMQPTLEADPNTTTGLRHRLFVLGTYLLLEGSHTYLNVLPPNGSIGVYYYPEYDVNIGPALAAPASDVSSYLWNGVYRRDFRNGLVLVNPGSSTLTINLGQSYDSVSALGGGAIGDSSVDSSNNYIGGSVTLTSVSQVTLAPGSAAILLNHTPTPLAPAQNLTASAGDRKLTLSWTPSSDAAATGSRIVRRTDAYPTSPTDGTVVYEGSASSFTDTGLTNGQTYYYKAFSYDDYQGGRVYALTSTSPQATATPPGNTPPAACNDAYSTFENQPLNMGAPGVLGNDIAGNNPTFTAVLVTGPSHGTLTLKGNGAFTYTSFANFNGTDSFTYKASDGALDSNIASAILTVIPVNNAPLANSDTLSVFEDMTMTPGAPGVLGNDADVDSPTLKALLVTGPSHGTLTLNANGALTYAPWSNYNGPDSFTYRGNDGLLNSGVALVTIDVISVNDAPAANDDSRSVFEDMILSVAAPGLLADSSDIDSPTLTAMRVAGPAHGALTLNGNGAFTYTPSANYNGMDSFTYQANDGLLNSNVATLTIAVISVNDSPLANNDSRSIFEDQTLTVFAPGVLVNDSDSDSSTLTAILGNGPAHGSLSLNANGAYTYVPTAYFNGSDSFTYEANDGLLNSNLATVTITVIPVNHAPVGNSDAYTLFEDASLSVNSPGVLRSDTDIDGSSLTSILATGPGHGTLTLRANGSFRYTPSAHYSGTDRFTYRASDGALNSPLVTVTLYVLFVNHAPVASDDTYNLREAPSLVVAGIGVLANDTDVDNSPLTAILVTGPALGTLTLSGNGSFTYTPSAGFFGTDSFRYRASDGSLNSGIATVTLTVMDVSSLVSTLASGLINIGNGVFNGTITITNTSLADIIAPLQLVLTSLIPGVTLQNKTGDTPSGNPYITIPSSTLPAGKLAAGQSIQVAVVFNDPLQLPILWTVRTLSGTI